MRRRGNHPVSRVAVVAVTVALLAALAPNAVAEPPSDAVDPGSVLVRLERGATKAAVFAEVGLATAAGEPIGESGWLEVRTDGLPVEEVLADLEATPGVADVEPNVLMSIEGVRRAANDPIFRFEQYRYLRTIRMPQAWSLTKGADQTTIAILDSGVDLDHPDLAARLTPGIDIVNGDSSPADDNGHGTFVAGIAGATTNNRRGVASPAWRTRIMPVKVLSSTGVGKVADVARGLDWAVAHGADVINMSFGGTASASVLDEAIARAAAADVVLVAGSGNDGLRGTPTYPAALPDVIAVGATDRAGATVNWSNVGSYLDLVAPGVGIRSTYLSQTEAYGVGDGTSFSAPLVASTAALARVRFPADSAAETSKRLIATARDAGPTGPDTRYGEGILDAYAALSAA